MSAFWGIVTGTVLFLVSRITYDAVSLRIQLRRLKSVLVMESVATVKRLRPVLKDLEETNLSLSDGSSGISIEQIKQFVYGAVLSHPDSNIHQLILLVRHDRSRREILHFLDRWERLIAFEQLLRSRLDVTYNHFITLSGDAGINSDTEFDDPLTMEYWDQLLGIHYQLMLLALELCDYSCVNIRRYTCGDDRNLRSKSENLWESWGDFVASHNQFKEKLDSLANGGMRKEADSEEA